MRGWFGASMKKSDDIVLSALIRFERYARAHISGGLLGEWELAKAALAEYKRRLDGATE